MPLVNYWGFGYTPDRITGKVYRQKVDSLLGLVGFVWMIATAVPQASVPLLLIVALAAVFGPSQDIAIWIFRGKEVMEYEALLVVLRQVLWVLLISLFLFKNIFTFN